MPGGELNSIAALSHFCSFVLRELAPFPRSGPILSRDLNFIFPIPNTEGVFNGNTRVSSRVGGQGKLPPKLTQVHPQDIGKTSIYLA